MATHSSILAWKTPWEEEPGRLQSMRSRRVGQDLSAFTFAFHFHALEKEMATHSKCSCLENPRDGGAWWAALYGVAQSQTRLKRLSRSSSRCLIYSICPLVAGLFHRALSSRFIHVTAWVCIPLLEQITFCILVHLLLRILCVSTSNGNGK